MTALQNGHGRYYFNSGFYIRTYPGLYHAAGTTVKYSGASSSQESITAPGPLHAKLVVKVHPTLLSHCGVKLKFELYL